MRLKPFTQAYFLIKCNSSFEHSLIQRAKAIVNSMFVVAVALYAWYPCRYYATEKVQ